MKIEFRHQCERVSIHHLMIIFGHACVYGHDIGVSKEVFQALNKLQVFRTITILSPWIVHQDLPAKRGNDVSNPASNVAIADHTNC